MWRLLPLYILITLFSANLWAERLYVVEQVSDSRSVFVINHGMKDGIIAGQRSLFTTKDFSMVAIAEKVTRFYSIWRPIDPNYQVPFKAHEVVHYNSNRDGIFKEIPQLKYEYDKLKAYQKHLLSLKRIFHPYTLRITVINGISESASDVGVIQDYSRLGIHYSLFYNLPLSPSFALNFGGRYDAENLKMNFDPGLTIPVSRLSALIGVTYFFNGDIARSKYYYYMHLTAGLGKADSVVSGEQVSGSSIILPSVALGLELKLTKRYAFILELGIESIKTSDTFSESGESQINNQTTLLLTGGLAF